MRLHIQTEDTGQQNPTDLWKQWQQSLEQKTEVVLTWKTGLILSTVCKQLERKSRMLGNVQHQDVQEQQTQDKHRYLNPVNEKLISNTPQT